MKEIVAGTTPTIEYTFRSVVPSDITTALLTFKKDGIIILRKDLADAEVLENKMFFLLSQADTLKLGTGNVEIMLNWVDTNGIRGVGNTEIVKVLPNHKNEVMT